MTSIANQLCEAINLRKCVNLHYDGHNRTVEVHAVGVNANTSNTLLKGTAAQALLDRGWGKPRVEVVTNEQPDSYITALQAVSARLDASKQSERTSTVQAPAPRN